MASIIRSFNQVGLMGGWFILFVILDVRASGGDQPQPSLTTKVSSAFQVGAQRSSVYLPFLSGKRVGLVVNQTSMVGAVHLVDQLIHDGIDVRLIFAPEHGFRGQADAGVAIANSTDSKTGLAIVSIYGEHKQASAEVMDQLDIVVFDIQDVGVRFYTYISSMHEMMDAAAQTDTEFMVLDRPNPNGRFVDGPIRKPGFESFVGKHPIPVLHGLTVAELAAMIVGEGWLKSTRPLRLITVPMTAYHHQIRFSLPIKPSPNLPNDQAIRLYPSLCFFEATAMSIGRGTDFPFQVLGYDKYYDAGFGFTPRSIRGAASRPKLMAVALRGIDLRQASLEGLDLSLLIQAAALFKANGAELFTRPDFMDKLSGTDQLREAIQAGHSEDEIRQSWASDLVAYKKMRRGYLLYPD